MKKKRPRSSKEEVEGTEEVSNVWLLDAFQPGKPFKHHYNNMQEVMKTRKQILNEIVAESKHLKVLIVSVGEVAVIVRLCTFV